MTSVFTHLDQVAQQLMMQPTDMRIRHIGTDHWVGYPKANDAIAQLNNLMTNPPSSSVSNMLLIGAPGSGKTSIARRFQKLHPPVLADDGGHCPVMLMQMPSKPTDSEFWGSLLDEFRVLCRPSDRAEARRRRAIALLGNYQTRMLLIDEFHNLLFASPSQRQQLLGLIKNLSNQIQIPIVAVGTEAAEVALRTDAQLDRRFRADIRLEPWKIDRDFLGMLSAFERLLPLAQPSRLASKEVASAIHRLSNGTIDSVCYLLRAAAVAAIDSGQEHIDLALIETVGKTLRHGRSP